MIAAEPIKYLLSTLGWDAVSIIVISFCTFLLLMSIILVRNIKIVPKKQESIILAFKAALSLFRNKALLGVFLYSFTTWLVIMSFAGYWLKNYLIQVHEYTEIQALDLVQVYWASFMISSLLVSLTIKDLASAKIVACLLAGLGLLTYFIMAVPIVFSYNEVLMVVICGGISASGVIVAFSLLPQLAPPELSGSVVAVNNTFIVLGGFIGQVLFGYILDNIDISNLAKNYDFGSLETHYYSALLIYPVFTLFAFISIFYAVSISSKKTV